LGNYLLVRLFFSGVLAVTIAGCGRADTGISTAYPAPENTAAEISAAYPAPLDNGRSAPTLAVLFPARVLGLVIDGDMRVLHVESGGSAEQAGIMAGDVLDTIDDISLASNMAQAKEIIYGSGAGQKLVLEVETSRQRRAGGNCSWANEWPYRSPS
jgi:hypothetical protein